ncbi:MAG: PF20097 family protein [Oscillospiraceae bacterium]
MLKIYFASLKKSRVQNWSKRGQLKAQLGIKIIYVSIKFAMKRKRTSMKCPYCGEEMEQGILRANGNIRWMPLDAKEPLIYSREKYEKQQAVLFPPYWSDKSWCCEETIAFACCKCKKMIVDFPLK